MYPTLTSSARSSIRSFLMKRTSFERRANRLRGYHPCCLSLLYHILETLSIKNFNDAVFGVVFYVLALIQSAGRGIHYLSAFRAAPPRWPSSRRQAPTPRKPPPAFRFHSTISGSPLAGLPRFYPSALPSFCAAWAPASGALALYYILQTYIIMYV